MFWFIYSRPKFSTQMPYLFIIKIRFTIKVNSICDAGRDTRNLCHKFISQSPALRILGLRVANPKSQGPSSGVLGVRVSCLRVLEFQVPESRVLVPGLRVPESRVSVSHGPGSQCPRVPGLRASGSRVPGPGSQVLIVDCAFLKCSKPSIFQETSN